MVDMIQILDSDTINKIAAGEVIERPASALKELLENAADSGATRIEVDFEEGGKKLIRVKDNGHGMTIDELPLSIARHATSKIKNFEDLEKLSSFGFRGEALASLAAVSELDIHSGKPGTSLGAKLISCGGSIDEAKVAANIEGTQVTIKNLFYNVPARFKFLKSDAGETTAIKKVLKAFALANPDISLTVRQGGKTLSHWGETSFQKRALQILDLKEQETLHVDIEESGIHLKAMISKPEFSVPTQQNLWFFVQSRPVQDRTLLQAVLEGYRNLLMHHQYPQAVVSLTIDATQVDVNVHPTKAQVKFQNPGLIFRFVNHSIKQAFEKEFRTEIIATPPLESYTLPEQQQEFVREAVVQYNQREFSSQVEVRTTKGWSSLQLIGQYASTYIVTQNAKALVLVDQHAAHERVLFERLKLNFQQSTVEKQTLLFEELIELPAEFLDAVSENPFSEMFVKLGFDLNRRGPTTLGISAKPAFLTDIAMTPLFERLAEQVSEYGEGSALDDLLTDLWASMACHGAIRAGRVLSSNEMQSLLEQMDEFAFSSFCPHGRPVSVQLTQTEFEKMFKRIV